ncbi:MAG: dTMP kinase [Bradymonadales bacterium]|nr:dTMP kinase [Bradymonadales bacterium]
MSIPPIFIALEGLDGAGTTTQGNRLRHWLLALGRTVLLTREPSDGPVGALIRRILKGQPGEFDPSALALLFAADRLDHLASEIRPSLAAGQDVISDRYVLSSLSYQSLGGNLDWVRILNQRAPAADFTLFLDVPPQTCIQRLASRGNDRELFERLDTLDEVRRLYLDLVGEMRPGQDVALIDGTLPVEQVTEAIRQALGDRFGLG